MDDLNNIYEKIKSSIIEQISDKKEIAMAFSYYNGAQWDPSLKQLLQLEGKPALTYNYILRTVEFLKGMFRKIKLVDRFLPKNPESVDFSAIASQVVKYVYDTNNVDKLFPKVFQEMILAGQAFIRVYVDYLKDPNGQIILRKCDPKLVFWDTNSVEDDFSDANFVFEIFYVEKDELIANYPKYKEEIEAASKISRFILGEPIPFKIANATIDIFKADYSRYEPAIYRTPTFMSPTKVEVAIYEEKFVENTYFIYDRIDKMYYQVPEKIKLTELRNYINDLNNSINEFRFEIENKKAIKLRQLVLLPEASVVLEETINPYGLNDFTIVPFFGFGIENSRFGLYRLLKDPQDEINKKKSLTMEVLKETPINKWFIPKTAVSTTEELVELENMVDNPDIHFIPINTIQGFPQPAITDSIQKINAVLNLEVRSELQLKDLAGITDAIMGIVPRKIQSGKAIQRLQEASLIYFENFIDSFKESRKLLTKLVFKIAQNILPNNYIVRIAKEETGEIDFRRINVVLGDKNILTLAKTDFDIVVELVDESPTMRIDYLSTLVRLAELGIPVPPELIIEYMNVPSHLRKRIFEFYKQIQQQKQKEEAEE